MNPLILVVEDNEKILYNIRLILEINNYKVITANNGKNALKLLSALSEFPDLIISDIIMPEMNGYDFFKAVSKNPLWNRIPFIFLTARTSIEDVRFGKSLGVDDYLKKPFKEEDLLAVVLGKISRYQKSKVIGQKFEDHLSTKSTRTEPSIKETDKNNVILLKVDWDDTYGPTLAEYFPKEEKFLLSINKIGTQLFQASVSMYGNEQIFHPEGFLLAIENIQKQGYIYFDTYPDENMRDKSQNFMLALIAPNINYFDSLKIKKIFQDLASQIKQQRVWQIKNYYEQIFEILSAP